MQARKELQYHHAVAAAVLVNYQIFEVQLSNLNKYIKINDACKLSVFTEQSCFKTDFPLHLLKKWPGAEKLSLILTDGNRLAVKINRENEIYFALAYKQEFCNPHGSFLF